MSEQRSLLLTDVVDSTHLAEQLGDVATAALWSAHDRAARDLLPRWNGREIDKTDGMLLLFEQADEALDYAAAYQHALASLTPPLQARVGLHVGAVSLRENSAADIARGAKPLEVDGAAKAIAARVMSVALGGQILLSAQARQALRDPDRRLLSHGHWRLKGLADPVELFESGFDGAPWTPPPDADKAYRVVRQPPPAGTAPHDDDAAAVLWLPAREIRHSLPAERDAFVGRGPALADLAQRLQAGARLVSVLGIGGTGKTRLVVRFGWNWLGDYPGGVWFCDLSASRSAAGLAHAVAVAFDVPLGRGDPVLQLGHAIAGHGRCLLILDNFEQVARYAGETLGRWLDRAADACFLVTTREVLGLPGEQALALPPLVRDEAVALFIRRAAAARSGWQPDGDDIAAITELVRLLDGLPLAIELAAARVRVMAPRTLLARMGERFKLLASTGGRHDRQATLRATFDWSWELLAESDKAALAQLAVFAGGFTLESAEAVLDLSAAGDDRWPADALQSLLDKSFVRALANGRFDLLVSVQDYAAEHLRSAGRFAGSGVAALHAAQLRHCSHFAALGARRCVDQVAEIDNLIVASQRALARGDGECAAGALEGAWAALSVRGPFEAGVQLAESICAMRPLGVRASARAQRVHADALVACGRAGAALQRYPDALAAARVAADPDCEAALMIGFAGLLLNQGRNDEARSQFVAVRDKLCVLGDRRLEAAACNGLGNLESNEGHFELAAAHYAQALALARQDGDRRLQGSALGNLCHLHAEIGQLGEASSCCEQALALAREAGNRYLEASLLCNLGMLLMLDQRAEQASAASQAALVMARELGYVRLESIIQCNLGISLESLGRPVDALASFEAALQIARALGDRRVEGQILGYRGLLHARQQRPDDARGDLQAGATLLRDVADANGLGVLLCARAEAELRCADGAAAASALAEAGRLAGAVGAGAASELGLALTRVGTLIAAAAGAAQMSAAAPVDERRHG